MACWSARTPEYHLAFARPNTSKELSVAEACALALLIVCLALPVAVLLVTAQSAPALFSSHDVGPPGRRLNWSSSSPSRKKCGRASSPTNPSPAMTPKSSSSRRFRKLRGVTARVGPDAGFERGQRPFTAFVRARRTVRCPRKSPPAKPKAASTRTSAAVARPARGLDTSRQPVERLRGERDRRGGREARDDTAREHAWCVRYRGAVIPLPWMTMPGRAPVWRPSSSTTRPLTMTVGMPAGY